MGDHAQGTGPVPDQAYCSCIETYCLAPSAHPQRVPIMDNEVYGHTALMNGARGRDFSRDTQHSHPGQEEVLEFPLSRA